MEAKINELKEKIEVILNNTLPQIAWRNVFIRQGISNKYIGIAFAASDYNINGVNGQKPCIVSLNLDPTTMELTSQIYGGNGGNHCYREPDPSIERERYLALGSFKVPFRTPKKEEKFVLNAIEKFAQNWIKAMREQKRELLRFPEYVNYDELLK